MLLFLAIVCDMSSMGIDEMRAEIFRHKRAFGRIVTEWEESTWIDYYAQDFKDLREPSEAILGAIQNEVTSIFQSKELGESALRAMKQRQWVSTTDHHGLLCHPYFYSSNLAQSYTTVRSREDVLVTLPFGNVSLGNDSFPRGFFFHDKNFKIARFIFKSLKERSMPVCAVEPFSLASFTRECDRVLHLPLGSDARERLSTFLTALRRTEGVWSQTTYSAQLTVCNQVLWTTLFPNKRGTLLYVDIESIVRRLLTEKHFIEDTRIHRLLTNAEWRMAFVHLFEGVPGSHTKNTGTHFFWYIDTLVGIRRGLRVLNDTLVTEEGDVTIECSAGSLMDALVKGRIIPSTVLTLLIVHAEERLTCAGGVSQLDYVHTMMERWQKLLQQCGIGDTIQTNTGILAGEQALFGMRSVGHESALASLFDVLMYESHPYDVVERALETTKIRDTIDAMLPTLYWLVTRKRVSSLHELRIPHIIHT